MLQRPKSLDRQNSSTDPCLQAGIMPAPIEIFDSNPDPVWSCMPSHCARIFSGLQVSGHDTALGMRTQINELLPTIWLTCQPQQSYLFIYFYFFWQTWQCYVSFSPCYVPTIDSCCNSLRNIIKTRLIPMPSIIYSLWKHDLGAVLFISSYIVSLLSVTLEKQVDLNCLMDRNLAVYHSFFK